MGEKYKRLNQANSGWKVLSSAALATARETSRVSCEDFHVVLCLFWLQFTAPLAHLDIFSRSVSPSIVEHRNYTAYKLGVAASSAFKLSGSGGGGDFSPSSPAMKGKGKKGRDSSEDECPLQFLDFEPLNITRYCPRYTASK